MIRLLALLLSLSAIAAPAAPGAGAIKEFNVELPSNLREIAGRGKLSPVAHALVTIAMPNDSALAPERPVLVISATSDAGGHSSRALLRAYAETALASGWTLVAADPGESIPAEQDDVPLRLALNTAALTVVARQWPGADKAPLAFGGFSGGAKYSGWLAAAFASQGRVVIGMYLAGINQDTVVDAATQFKVLDTNFKRIPVFLQAGESDEVATLSEHQGIAADLARAGFRNVRIVSFEGVHEVEPGPMVAALKWFRELEASPAAPPR